MSCEFGGGGGGRISVKGAVGTFAAGGVIGTTAAALDSDHTHTETWPENQEQGPYTSPPITSDEALSGDSLLDMPALETPAIQVTGDYDTAGVGELMGRNVFEARVVQRGGRTFKSATARKLNNANGTNHHQRDFGRALEDIKDAFGIRHDNHSSRIFDDGSVDYEVDGSWRNVGNLYDWLD